MIGFDHGQDFGVGDESAFDHLRQTGNQVGSRQRRQRIKITNHTARLVETADQVLSFRRVDAGLASDRGVHHAEQGGRDHDQPDASQPGRRHETGQIGGRTTTEADNRIGAGESGIPENRPTPLRDRDTLRVLAVGHIDTDRLQPRCAQLVR